MNALAVRALDILRLAVRNGPAVFSSSLGAEDMVLLDLIERNQLPIAVFTLDTGRLPEETYRLLQTVREKYTTPVQVLFPRADGVERLVQADGVNGFYQSVEQRKACCAVRKLEPLARGLAGKQSWVTGLRAGQSVTRTAVVAQEHDEQRGLEKFNPLFDWSEDDVWLYIRSHSVPYNLLHDRFYPSIGCAPCTRAIAVGEDVRAGRWWWEDPQSKECGLHQKTVSFLNLQEPA
jgi:phosphoadenosine phosphosulfate reductase